MQHRFRKSQNTKEIVRDKPKFSVENLTLMPICCFSYPVLRT